MINICRQGNGHYLNGINNQDFYYAEKNLKMIMDGCSEGRFSEVGTRLFYQFFCELEDKFNPNKFEENVKKVFDKMISFFGGSSSDCANKFIVDNMLFTIVACFEVEDRFVVKYIGDGYIITINSEDMLSYIRLSYGKMPPYFAYNFLDTGIYSEKLEFKTLEFLKEDFKKVGIASDGITPIVKKNTNRRF